MSLIHYFVSISLLLLSDADRYINLKYDINIPINFLNGVEHCDVQIFHDTTSADSFAFLENSYLPRTIYFMQSYRKTDNLCKALFFNILRSRPDMNKVSILISKFLFQTEETKSYGKQDLTDWLKLCTRYHYAFSGSDLYDVKSSGEYWTFLHSTKNIYPIVPTTMGLDLVLKTFKT